jgi:dTDP-4-amino-4,6-dideoxygalactose transaminase
LSGPATSRAALLGGASVRPGGPPTWPLRDAAVDDVFAELAASGDWGRYHGPWCERLVELLSARFGVPHVGLCCSGTAAVELALRGVGVQAGDEVLLAAYDFKSNFTNVLHLGATPVLVDVSPHNGQLDVQRLDAARSERTRCVVASHLHGGLVDLAALRAWAAPYGIAIVEDACQATGATVAGRPAGTVGDVGVLSFGGSKLLTAGRGGATLTHRDDVAQRIKLAAHRGNDAYPLSEMQAAVLIPQVERLAEQHRRRAAAVERLCPELERRGLRPLSTGVTRAEVSTRPPDAADDPAYYKFGLLYEASDFAGLTRDRFAAAMRAEGIALDAGFRPLHLTHARSRFRAAGDLAVAEAVADRIVTLHHPVLLSDQSDLGEVIAALDKVAQLAVQLRDWDGTAESSA